jgi:hypothetical protein
MLTHLKAVQGIESSLILSSWILYCVSGWPFIKVVSFLAIDSTSSNIEQSHKSQWHLCLPEYGCSCINKLKQCCVLRYKTSGLLHCVVVCVAPDVVIDHMMWCYLKGQAPLLKGTMLLWNAGICLPSSTPYQPRRLSLIYWGVSVSKSALRW